MYFIKASKSQSLWESFRDKLEGHSPWNSLQMTEECGDASNVTRHRPIARTAVTPAVSLTVPLEG